VVHAVVEQEHSDPISVDEEAEITRACDDYAPFNTHAAEISMVM